MIRHMRCNYSGWKLVIFDQKLMTALSVIFECHLVVK